MKMADTFFLFIVAALLQGSLADTVLSNNQSRIVNGILVSPGERPYQISLHQNGIHNCGGSILNAHFVLTAAHCAIDVRPQQLKVIAGTVDLNDLRPPASSHSVSNIIIHAKFSYSAGHNDIALLQVRPPFRFSRFISPAKLPLANSIFKSGVPAIVSGFGRVWENGPTSRRLLKTNVFTVTQDYCRKVHGPDITATNICTKNAARVTGFCNADSGGPLTINGKVIGIVSYALNGGCAGPDQTPQVFTLVSEYIHWIKNHI